MGHGDNCFDEDEATANALAFDLAVPPAPTVEVINFPWTELDEACYMNEVAEKELKQLRTNAARYRWARENLSDDLQWYLLGTHGHGADDLDAAIDAAMTKRPNL